MNRKINYLKACFIIAVGIYGFICARDVTETGLLDRVNLIAHEAGHLLFGYFGEFIMVTGGTIGQLFVPAAFVVYFITRKEFYSSSISLFWFGQNMFGISVYIKDASAMALPLISMGGGKDTIHDWNYILLRLGLLRWDQTIGNAVCGIGVAIIAVSVILGLYFSFEEKE